jgi:anti-anti-sigma regulatory factor
VILDMRDITQVSSAGLMALHSIAVLFRGQIPPDPEAGWGALHTVAEDVNQGLQCYVKLFAPQPQVRQVLNLVGFTMFFEILGDLEATLTAWGGTAIDAQPAQATGI